jgi:DNA repair exonuclease SbcCD nuclease subunit
MKAIIFSDIHLHSWAKFNRDNYRLKNQLDTLEHLFQVAFRSKVPIIFGGDMFMDPESLKNSLLSVSLPFIQDLFRKYNVDFFAISGNHDLESENSLSRRAPTYINTLANTIESFHNIDFDSADFGDWVLHGVPYLMFNRGIMDHINSITLDKSKFNILLLHTDFKGQVDTNGFAVGKGENISESGLRRFDLVLSGHIHKPGLVKNNIFSIGAPMQIRLSDMGGKFGYWVLDDKFKLTFREINDTPKFRLYEKESEVENDFDFWVKIPREDDLTVMLSTDIDLSNREELIKQYLRWKGIKGYSYFKTLMDLVGVCDE